MEQMVLMDFGNYTKGILPEISLERVNYQWTGAEASVLNECEHYGGIFYNLRVELLIHGTGEGMGHKLSTINTDLKYAQQLT